MALIEKLNAIGDAIRAKNGSEDKYSLDGMVTAIGAIETGGGSGGLTEEERTFTGDISYLFANGKFIDWQDKYPFILKDITRAQYTFQKVPNGKDLSKITINTAPYNNDATDGAYVNNLFESSKSETLPTVNGVIALLSSNLFNNCRYLKDEEVRKFIMNSNLKFSWFNSSSRLSNPGIDTMFYYCVSLRNINDVLLYIHQYYIDNPTTYTSNLTDYYSCAFYYCEGLDEIRNIPVLQFLKEGGTTSNAFSNAFSYCGRAKEVIFATDNGTPYVKKWKNQTIDLSTRIGYAYNTNFLNYNSGITAADKAPTDDFQTFSAFIEANPDNWWTDSYYWARYDRQSAIRTINSLPDTSAYLTANGGTNTIKFKNNQGSSRGENISNLSAEQIAVATAKGWTVSFV